MQGFHSFRILLTLPLIVSTWSCAQTLDHVNQSSHTDFAQSQSAKWPLDPSKFERTIEDALNTFDTPSMSVGIYYQGQAVFMGAKGYRNIEKKQLATPETFYRLASVSKAFTAAGLAVLVDKKALSWDDKVIDHLPEFKLNDPWVTREFTVLDLLTHRSGLASAAGDSMIWPEPSGFARKEVIHNLQFLTPSYSFRDGYSYSNVLYIAAGEIIARISGMSFEEFIDTRIFQPLSMNCFAGALSDSAMKNIALSYGFKDEGGYYPIPRNQIHGNTLMSSAAGGMVCNVSEMMKWIEALLTRENLPFSADALETMWQSYNVLNVSQLDTEWDGTHFQTYGLGWRISNLFEYKMVYHTGTLSGYQAYIALVPELDLGVILLNNGSNYGARGAVMQTVLKSVIAEHKGLKSATDWVKAYREYQEDRAKLYQQNFTEVPDGSGDTLIEAPEVIGSYKDKWFGAFNISQVEGMTNLRITHDKMSTLTGSVIPHSPFTYKVEWDNQNAQRDAFIFVDLDHLGNVTGMKMHPYISEQRENHEYRDMYFTKQTAP